MKRCPGAAPRAALPRWDEAVSAYVTRRILTSIPTLLVIVTVAFFMIRIAPGEPFDRERALPPEIEKHVLAAYDLDQPLLAQYADYLLDVLGAISGRRSSTATSPSPSCCGPGSRRA